METSDLKRLIERKKQEISDLISIKEVLNLPNEEFQKRLDLMLEDLAKLIKERERKQN